MCNGGERFVAGVVVANGIAGEHVLGADDGGECGLHRAQHVTGQTGVTPGGDVV